MKIIERNLQEIGKSLLVTLPKSWTKSLNLTKGSSIKMMVSEDGRLIIAPELIKKNRPKEASITLDSHFPRRFFREYLKGSESITIFLKNPTDSDLKALHAFLKKFMNVQVIEETKEKVVAKCFNIEELSIEECLRRAYFLSLNMIGETINEESNPKLTETENSLTKFYYLLVMQIRRFLDEGRYTQNNQIPLIRAMDMRMVGEKIERIADIVKSLNTIDSENKDLLKSIKEYYTKAFESFISENYEKAVLLWDKQKEIKLRCEQQQERAKEGSQISLYKQASDLKAILDYAKDISMLVR